MKRGDPRDRYGRIIPIHDDDYIGEPIIGFVIRMEDGFYTVTSRDECDKHDTFDAAVSFIRKRWRATG
jgi:hypothetical protein